ncbi:hypothetical protein BC939DRAFT_15869 [Gamsiella multidivaricata]|uniref:uncharacterized protein n=1 Tax=Gamsiella multidivaricata TaxID=101098 RepID=UPI00221EDF67|nr:uncharacterized protein BC939DRAFT_15869 [Gamsiella multidivaricata]KAI7817173.1 hypothetical protein BC939DRAFT_15869 [Gamsiella multidivaricata]
MGSGGSAVAAPPHTDAFVTCTLHRDSPFAVYHQQRGEPGWTRYVQRRTWHRPVSAMCNRMPHHIRWLLWPHPHAWTSTGPWSPDPGRYCVSWGSAVSHAVRTHSGNPLQLVEFNTLHPVRHVLFLCRLPHPQQQCIFLDPSVVLAHIPLHHHSTIHHPPLHSLKNSSYPMEALDQLTADQKSILEDYLAVTGQNDLEVAILALEQHSWQLETAVQAQFGDTRTPSRPDESLGGLGLGHATEGQTQPAPPPPPPPPSPPRHVTAPRATNSFARSFLSWFSWPINTIWGVTWSFLAYFCK